MHLLLLAGSLSHASLSPRSIGLSHPFTDEVAHGNASVGRRESRPHANAYLPRQSFIGGQNPQPPPTLPFQSSAQRRVKVPQVTALANTDSVRRIGNDPSFSICNIFERSERPGYCLGRKLNGTGDSCTLGVSHRRLNCSRITISRTDVRLGLDNRVFGFTENIGPEPPIKRRPVHELKAAPEARSLPVCDKRGFDWDGSRPAHRIDEMVFLPPPARQNHRRRQRLAQWCFRDFLPISTPMKKCSRGIGADLTFVVHDPHNEKLDRRAPRVTLGLYIFVPSVVLGLCVFAPRPDLEIHSMRSHSRDRA